MTLKLILKTKWYELIDSGIKLEEYREITDYWVTRMCKGSKVNSRGQWIFREFDQVRFYLGYQRERPTMLFKVKSIHEGFGKSEWGANPQNPYFIIQLGERIGSSTKGQCNRKRLKI